MPKFAFVLALLLAGCAGQGTGHLAALATASDAAPPAGPPAAPALADTVLIAGDGARLPLRAWLPEDRPRAVILGLHGFNDYSNAFAAPAAVWAKDGIATYAYDQRGFGEAPLRGRWPGTQQLADDLATASRLLKARYPGTPLYCLGESMGGAVVAAAASGGAGAPRPACDGLILAAPAVWGRATMNVFERTALWTGDTFFPDMTLTGRGLNIMPSDNIAMLRELSRDPLVIKETRVAAVKGLVDLMDTALASAPDVTVPMLMLYGDRDELVPREPTERFIEALPFPERRTRRIAWYEAGYHMLLRDLEGPLVWRDVESWIGDHAAPLPSGADQRASAVLFAGGVGDQPAGMRRQAAAP
ncbi:MAG: lysophospholipase [Stellaceae bacterium]